MRAHLLASIVLASLVVEPALARPSPITAVEIFRKGVALYQAGGYGEAEPLMKEALNRSEREFGPNNPGAAAVRTTVANLYRQQGRYAEAEPLYRNALAAYEKALGPDDPSLSLALDGLASLYTAQARFAEAEQLFQRALANREKVLDRTTLTSPRRSGTSPSCTRRKAASRRPTRCASAPCPSNGDPPADPRWLGQPAAPTARFREARGDNCARIPRTCQAARFVTCS